MSTKLKLPHGRLVAGGKELLCECPSCGKKKFYINVAKAVGICHVCQRGMGPKKLVDIFGAEEEGKGFHLPGLKPVLLFNDEWIPDDLEDPDESLEAVQYLYRRRVYQALWEKVGVRWSPSRQRLYFPIFAPSNELPMSWMSRVADREPSKGAKWISPPGTKKEHYWFGWEWQNSPRVVLVEGIFDVISPGLLGMAVALLGTRLTDTHCVALRNCGKPVVIWRDPGKPGKQAAESWVRKLDFWGIPHNSIPVDDEKDTDPGDCTDEKTLELVRELALA